jgi:hypothetical protein
VTVTALGVRLIEKNNFRKFANWRFSKISRFLQKIAPSAVTLEEVNLSLNFMHEER